MGMEVTWPGVYKKKKKKRGKLTTLPSVVLETEDIFMVWETI